MKHFLALPAVLRVAAILASASQHSFSVHDDLLAFPQYEIQLREDWISEDDAQARLLSKPGESQGHGGEGDEDAIGKYQGGGTADGTDEEHSDATKKLPVEYEYMVMDGQRWLCSVPLVTKREDADAVNETQSRAEEEKELARATDRGWELLSGMSDHCVYFIAGWWSYRFCYNQGVKQFHQLPPSRGVPAYPPVEDPGVQGFVLGSYEKSTVDDDDESAGSKEGWNGQSALGKTSDVKHKHRGSGELIQRGESRYLVQYLGGGTRCDLTGKERNIEVQFHCNPSSGDKISLLKETATCMYLMVIQTPRLCHDVAFLPPQKDRPNPVMCSPILTDNEVEGYEKDLEAVRTAERQAKALEAAAAALGGSTFDPPALVGDIYVGGHAMIPEDQKIEKSGILGGGKETYIDTVASSDGRVLSRQELEKLGMGDAKDVERLKEKLEKLAKGQSWKLDVVETPRGREYRGIINDNEDDTAHTKGGSSQKENKKDKDSVGEKKQAQKKNEKKGGKKTGSEEEFYKEEL